MADTKYYLSVSGVSDGFAFYGAGDVFVGSDATNALYERTGGKDVDGSDPERLLFEVSNKDAYESFLAIKNGATSLAATAAENGVAGPMTLLDNEGEDVPASAPVEEKVSTSAGAKVTAKK
jgi:hypothetical protein